MSLASKLFYLKERSAYLQKARSFFLQKGFLEVDTPILSKAAPVDEHIEIFMVDTDEGTHYLHSSPEYAMKRLLALGIGDIFQLGHVFRQGEVGSLHNPEFTMVEWYRMAMPFSMFIDECIAFIYLFLGPLTVQHLSYKEAFLHYTSLDPFLTPLQTLKDLAQTAGFHASHEDRDTLLQFLMAQLIEPHLGDKQLSIITDYPASQAALAQIVSKEEGCVAQRFEIYYQGIELANGYMELSDAQEQRKRLLHAQQKRQQAQKPFLPIDERLLQALSSLAPCCGVAAGFDRLLCLAMHTSSIAEVLPFSWIDC